MVLDRLVDDWTRSGKREVGSCRASGHAALTESYCVTIGTNFHFPLSYSLPSIPGIPENPEDYEQEMG